jgi:hypothetical protein
MEPMHPALVWILYQLREARLSPAELAFYLTLLSRSAESEGEAFCQASAAQIAREAGLVSRTVQLARAKFERSGWIRAERTRNRGRSPQEPNRYHIINPPPGWQVGPGTLHAALKWLLDQLREGRWSRGTLQVYLYLLSLTEAIPSHRPYCEPPVGQIAKDTGLGPRRVRDAVGNLQDREFVEVRARRAIISRTDGGPYYMRQVPNLYFIQQFPPEWQYLEPDEPSFAKERELKTVDSWYGSRSDHRLACSAATARQTEKALQEHRAPGGAAPSE